MRVRSAGPEGALVVLLALLGSCNTASTNNASTPSLPSPPSAPPPAAVKDGPTLPALDWGPRGKVVATGAPADVRARLSMPAAPNDPEPISEIGAPALIRYEVMNVGSVDITLWHAGFWPNHRISVVGPSGKEPALSPRGKSGADAFARRGIRGKNVEWKIKPGAVDDTEGSFDLAELFDLSAPGRYTARIEYEDDLAFSSNTLPFYRVRRGAVALLRQIGGWDPEEIDAFERPSAHPELHSAGETNGFLTSKKGALKDLGVEITWDAAVKRYRVVASH